MEKNFQFSEQPLRAKILYGVVVAILCIGAIVIGIVAAGSRKQPTEENLPPVTDNENPADEEKPTPEAPDTQEEKQTFVAPTTGKVSTGHSATVPVFSDTLGEWRIHTGIDITTDEGADVYVAAPGTVSKIYDDPMLGKTVEVTHKEDIVTVYSNLSKELCEGITVGKELAAGAKLGTVGDTSLSELAGEPHVHFAVRCKEVSVNPLDYISDASKKDALGMEV